jgi:hypothetical protein
MVCSGCGEQIPGDSTFCPICGTRTRDADAFDTLQDHAVPPQAAAGGRPRRTLRMNAAPEAAAVDVPRGDRDDIAPHRGLIGGGAVIGVAAMVVLIGVLVRVRSGDTRAIGGIVAGVVGACAAALVVTGLRYRPRQSVRCRVCGAQVLGWKGTFGLFCPLGPHYARISWPIVVVTAGFWLGVAAFALGFAIWVK